MSHESHPNVRYRSARNNLVNIIVAGANKGGVLSGNNIRPCKYMGGGNLCHVCGGGRVNKKKRIVPMEGVLHSFLKRDYIMNKYIYICE